MIRTVFAAIIVAAFAVPSANAAAGDCITNYRDFWDKQNQAGEAKPSTEDIVATHRQAIRAFDACQSGDETSYNDFWDKLRSYGGAKFDYEKFWTELQRAGAAKK